MSYTLKPFLQRLRRLLRWKVNSCVMKHLYGGKTVVLNAKLLIKYYYSSVCLGVNV